MLGKKALGSIRPPNRWIIAPAVRANWRYFATDTEPVIVYCLLTEGRASPLMQSTCQLCSRGRSETTRDALRPLPVLRLMS